MDIGNPWTRQELDILTEHYTTVGAKRLLTLLPGRSLGAIYSKAHYLQLGRTRGHTRFSAEEDALIYQHFPQSGTSRLVILLDRERSSIWRRACKLGLVLPQRNAA